MMLYLLYKLSYCQFCVRKQSAGYRGNMGLCGKNFNNTIRLLNPKNPLYTENILLSSLTVHITITTSWTGVHTAIPTPAIPTRR